MIISRNLFELQEIDSEIKQKQSALDLINQKLSSNENYVRAKNELEDAEVHLSDINSRKIENEYEVDELQKSIEGINKKLYSGKITNPKELTNLDQELLIHKRNLKQKEDNLLNLMSDEEQAQLLVKKKTEQLEKVNSEEQSERLQLLKGKDELTPEITELITHRDKLVSLIEPQIMKLYSSLISRKGHAVAWIEQGRCQGCRIALSTNEWQKAKSGVVTQCSSCGMILYLG
jgi:predicted  nucleic acid-binding Zn-ribbon protein